jgi:CBS domain-containing protein
MKAKDILKIKGPEVITILEDKNLFSALELLVNNKVGALLVLNNNAGISGIISERDIVRIVRDNPDNFKDITVKSVMTKDVVIVEAEDDMDYVETIMTQRRIRHLPVVNSKVLVGIISIGDIVKAQLSHSRFEIKYMREYITGA